MQGLSWVARPNSGEKGYAVELAGGRGHVLELASGMFGAHAGRPTQAGLPQGGPRGGGGGPPPTTPPMGELGSAFDRDRLFAFYEENKIFQQTAVQARDLNAMLAHDGKARAVEKALTLPLRGLDWNVVAAKGDKGEADFIREAISTPPEEGGMTIPFSTVIAQMTGASVFKAAFFEKCFRIRDDGKVVYDKLAFRMPDTCYLARWANDGSFAGFMQWTWKDQRFQKIMIPAEKAFVVLHGIDRNPLEGLSDMEVTWNVFQTKQKVRFLWHQFLENHSFPKGVFTDNTKDPEHAQAKARDAATLRAGGVIGLEDGQTFTPYAPGTQADQIFASALAYLDGEMAGSILAGFLELTGAAAHLGRGSMALSQDQSKFYLASRTAVAQEMADAITYGLFADLIRYNFGADSACPRVEFASLTQADTEDQAMALLTSLAAASTLQVPSDFVAQLAELTGTYLGMDPTRVTKAFKSFTPPKPTPTGPGADMHQAVGAAAQMVASAGGGGGGNGAAPATLPGIGAG